MKSMKKAIILSVVLVLSACTAPQNHAAEINDTSATSNAVTTQDKALPWSMSESYLNIMASRSRIIDSKSRQGRLSAVQELALRNSLLLMTETLEDARSDGTYSKSENHRIKTILEAHKAQLKAYDG